MTLGDDLLAFGQRVNDHFHGKTVFVDAQNSFLAKVAPLDPLELETLFGSPDLREHVKISVTKALARVPDLAINQVIRIEGERYAVVRPMLLDPTPFGEIVARKMVDGIDT